MAQLYLARHPVDGRLVALKRILPHLARDRVFVDMFLNEARVAATLHHPHLVTVFDFGEEDGEYFLAMEYVHGADLGELLDAAADADDLPLAVALTIVRDACLGLHHLHDQTDASGHPLALVHRDVSPSNILVREDGAVKITDFGIATATAHTRTTRPGTVKGKASYMSPEQCTGAVIDRRADIFALGIILYETSLLTRLFVGDNEFALMRQVVDGDFDRPCDIDPQFPAALESIILRALSPRPEDRYPTAAQMAVAIEAFAASRGIVLSSDPVAAWFSRRLGARPWPTASSVSPPAVSSRGGVAPWAWLAAGALVVVAGGTAYARWSTFTDPPPGQPTAADGSRPTRDEAAVAPPPGPLAAPSAATPLVTPSAPPDPDLELDDDDDDELVIVEEHDDAPTPPLARRPVRRRAPPTPTPNYDLDQAAPPR
jgi:serine/threonine protein kinase